MDEVILTVHEQLRQLQMLMHRASFSHSGKTNYLRRGQGRVLAILRIKPEISQKELTYLLGISKQAAAELTAKLEKSGYITREPSESDKRVMTVRLTEKGEKAVIDADEDSTEASEVLDCLNSDELAAFSDYLGRIIKRYEEKFPYEDFERRRQLMKSFLSLLNHTTG